MIEPRTEDSSERRVPFTYGHLAVVGVVHDEHGHVMRSAKVEISKLSIDAPTRCSSARTIDGSARSGRRMSSWNSRSTSGTDDGVPMTTSRSVGSPRDDGEQRGEATEGVRDDRPRAGPIASRAAASRRANSGPVVVRPGESPCAGPSSATTR